MDFRFTPQEEAFRQELRAWIRENVPPERQAAFLLEEDEEQWEESRRIVRRLAERGWLAPAWPRAYGGMEASLGVQLIYHEEMAYHRVPIGPIIEMVDSVGPAILTFGSEEQRRRHLPPIAAGETVWCQGFSEPGVGSDLASVQCRAVRDGDEYVIRGEKIWTSKAHHSDWCILLARTDPAAPRHRGLSFFLVDMRLPGITVRPVVNMAGVHGFNHIVFEDVRVPRDCLLGEENQGWRIAAAALGFDRFGLGAAAMALARRNLDDLARHCAETRVNGRPLLDEPRVRLRLAALAVEAEVGRFLVYQVASLQARGQPAWVEAAACKLYNTELDVRVANAGIEILGLYGQLRGDSPRACLEGRLQRAYLYANAMTIGGGTSEILRNLIAQQGLGLPRSDGWGGAGGEARRRERGEALPPKRELNTVGAGKTHPQR